MKSNIFFWFFSGIFVPVNSYFTVASHISLCASVLMIVALSHERYFAICSPHIYRIHMRSVSRWKHLAKVPFIYYVSTFKGEGGGSKMPKSVQNCPKSVQKASQKRPRSVQKFSKKCPKIVQNCPKLSKYAYVIHEWPLSTLYLLFWCL